MVDHREGVIASSEQQFATLHSPSSHSDRSRSWAYRDRSADLKPLQWISPDNARSQPLGPVGRVCSSLLRCAVEINSRVQQISACSCGVKLVIYIIINSLQRYKKTFCRECKPHFVGVWDTVSSVGWVYNVAQFPGTKATHNPDLKFVRHAVSIDERRAFFRQNLFGTPHDPQQ